MGRLLDDLLTGEKLKTKLQDVVKGAEVKAAAVDEFANKNSADGLTRNTMMDRWVYSPNEEKLAEILEEEVINDLQLPRRVTLKDLTLAASRCLLHGSAGFDERYKEFCRFMRELADSRNKATLIPVCSGWFIQHFPDDQCPLWNDIDRQFSVAMLSTLAMDDEHDDSDYYHNPAIIPVWSKRQIFIRVEGTCSSDAFQEFRQEVRSVLNTLFSGIAELHFLHAPVWVKFEDFLSTYELANTVSPMVDAYFSKTTKKDSIDRRIRNALHLLVQANGQRHNAISLALSVAAVEAMLCEKGDGIATQIAERSAILLEPDPKCREDAVKWVKKLYDRRSVILHGTKVEDERAFVKHARLLAVAVLSAYMGRRAFQQKMGFGESPKDLFAELETSKDVAGDIVGVSPSPIRALWRGPLPDKAE